jgi:transcriptional regulator with XRE-family HTH domain
MTGPELLALRKRLGLSRAALAARLDISESQLANYETGTTRSRGTPCPIPRVVELALLGPPIIDREGNRTERTQRSKRDAHHML